jgi:hypothetical protein
VFPPLQAQFVGVDGKEEIVPAPCGQSRDQVLDGLVVHDGHEFGVWTVGKPHVAYWLTGVGQVDEGDPRGVDGPFCSYRDHQARGTQRLEFMDQALRHLDAVGANEGGTRRVGHA